MRNAIHYPVCTKTLTSVYKKDNMERTIKIKSYCFSKPQEKMISNTMTLI